MSEPTVEQKSLPLTQDNTLIVLLLVTLTFYLYGFYWLDKQSRSLKEHFGICPFNDGYIKYGYITYGLTFSLPLLLETNQITDTSIGNLISVIAVLSGLIMFLIYLFCCLRYAYAISKIAGYREISFLISLGALLFQVIFLNWWQNEQAGKQGKLSINSN